MNIYLGHLDDGKQITADLKGVKNLLIQGSTGAGKTVFIDSIIKYLIKNYGSEELKFCIFSDYCCFLPEDIPAGYYYKTKKPIVENEVEAGMILSEILLLISARLEAIGKARKSSGVEEKTPTILLIFDAIPSYESDAVKEAMAEIIKNGWKAGVHIILSVQNALYGFKKAAMLCQSKLCGGGSCDYNFKVLLGIKNLPPLKAYEFLLSINGSYEIIKCHAER